MNAPFLFNQQLLQTSVDKFPCATSIVEYSSSSWDSQSYEDLANALRSASYVAVDTEFSGLGDSSKLLQRSCNLQETWVACNLPSQEFGRPFRCPERTCWKLLTRWTGNRLLLSQESKLLNNTWGSVWYEVESVWSSDFQFTLVFQGKLPSIRAWVLILNRQILRFLQTA